MSLAIGNGNSCQQRDKYPEITSNSNRDRQSCKIDRKNGVHQAIIALDMKYRYPFCLFSKHKAGRDWPSHFDLRRAFWCEAPEIGDEARRQLAILVPVFVLFLPGACRKKHVLRNAWAALRHFKPEDRVGIVFNVVERAGKGGVEERAGVLDAYALSNAEGSADPAGIDQPAGSAVAQHFALKQIGIDPGMMNHERCAEAGAEGDFRSCAYAGFCPGDLGRVAGNEMIERLAWRQPRNWRHNALCVAGQEKDILRVAAQLAHDGVVDVIEWIRGARVLGIAIIVQDDVTCDRVVDHIFEHGSKPTNRGINLWLRCRRQVNHLGVAAVLEVEHAVIAPAMLVVADQFTSRVRRERRLAGARKSEEQRRIAISTDIGGAVHTHDAFERQQIVEHSED